MIIKPYNPNEDNKIQKKSNSILASRMTEKYLELIKDDYIHHFFSKMDAQIKSIYRERLLNDFDNYLKSLGKNRNNLRNVDLKILYKEFEKTDYEDNEIYFKFKKGVCRQEKMLTYIHEKVRRDNLLMLLKGAYRDTFDPKQRINLFYALADNYSYKIIRYVDIDTQAKDVNIRGYSIKEYIEQNAEKIDEAIIFEAYDLFEDINFN